MKAPSIYLYFSGNCEEAFDTYLKIFGGVISVRSRYSEMPPSPDYPPIADHAKELIMHSTLTISEGVIIQGADLLEGFGPGLSVGNNFAITLTVDSRSEADHIHRHLSQGGNVTMPMQVTFWGSYFGSCIDRFGINWLLNTEASEQA